MDLAQVPCIRKVNTIHPTFAKELGLPIRATEVRAQKIDGTTLDIYRVVVAAFSVTDKTDRSLICLSSPWVMQTSIVTRSTEFASKKKGNCNIMVTDVTYKLHLNIKSLRHIHVMTTSWSFIHYFHIITSSHHRGTRLQQV